MDLQFIKKFLRPQDTKIVLLVLDGLGGLPLEPGGRTELEDARTPNLDDLAKEGVCGLHQPILPGITPGSGPAHLALFGYDPLEYQVGRGVLAALGTGFDLRPDDVAARGNFCTIDENGLVTDRRAGRIPTEENKRLCAMLREIRIPGVEIFVETVKEYRILLVLRAEGLSEKLSETDPQRLGVAPLDVRALEGGAQKTAELVNRFIAEARGVLSDEHPANMLLLRGFAMRPDWPLFPDAFGLKAAAVAAYPMYRGVASLVGMEVLETGETLEEEFDTLEKNWKDYDFFYVHVKKTDSAGEDGDFNRKMSIIEHVDTLVPRIMKLKPDVLVVTGDHSTPALLKSHSWHPVPVLIWSRYARSDSATCFGEKACTGGGLGTAIPATNLMPLALANALRLEKFGA